MKALLKTTTLSVFLLILVVGMVSCTTETEQSDIVIQNRTENYIHVTLFPIAELLRGDGFYLKCFGCGGSNSTSFTLPPNEGISWDWDELIFFTPDLNITPHALASQVFDSIHIRTDNDLLIRFTHENVVGFSENIFSENATWEFRIYEGHLKPQDVVKHHQHIFVISSDRIVANNP